MKKWGSIHTLRGILTSKEFTDRFPLIRKRWFKSFATRDSGKDLKETDEGLKWSLKEGELTKG